jgi:hypothetical protein
MYFGTEVPTVLKKNAVKSQQKTENTLSVSELLLFISDLFYLSTYQTALCYIPQDKQP